MQHFSKPGLDSAPYTQLADMVRDGLVTQLNYYPKDGMVMACTPAASRSEVAASITPSELHNLLHSGPRGMKFTSHLKKSCPLSCTNLNLQKEYFPDVDQGLPDADVDEHVSDFAWSQMPPIVDSVIDQFVHRFGAAARDSLTQADFKEVADAAKAAVILPAGAAEDERIFTRAQVRKLIEAVNAGCTEILESKVEKVKR